MGKCRTLVKGDIENTIPSPPPVFSTDPQSPFYKMVDEVYQVSLLKDANNMAMGLFWDDFPDNRALTAAGHWANILRTVMAQKNTSLMEGCHAVCRTLYRNQLMQPSAVLRPSISITRYDRLPIFKNI